MREYCQQAGIPFIAPSLSYVPELAIKTLEELIQAFGGDVGLIGSSLGGFYSAYLSEKFGLKAVLVNPAITPEITLKQSLGNAQNYYDESSFSWKDSHIEMLSSLKTEHQTPENIWLFVQKGDEVLDYQDASQRYADSSMIIEEGGNHSFAGFERYIPEIVDFLKKS